MLVQNNTLTPCCGNKMVLDLECLGAVCDIIRLQTTCWWCETESVATVPALEVYRTIRKSGMLFPVDSPFFSFGLWPIEGPVYRKIYSSRILKAFYDLNGHLKYLSFPCSVVPFHFSELARSVHLGLFCEVLGDFH